MYKINQENLRTPNIPEDSMYWDGEDFHILLKDDKELVFRNYYLSNITYNIGGSGIENVAMVGNNKKWTNM